MVILNQWDKDNLRADFDSVENCSQLRPVKLIGQNCIFVLINVALFITIISAYQANSYGFVGIKHVTIS